MTIDEAHKAVRRGLFWIRRGLHFVPMEPWPAGLRSYLAFRRTRPVVPAETPRIRHRAELASLSPSL